MNLEEKISKIRLELGMKPIDNSIQEKIEQLKWDILFDNAIKICEADDVEFSGQTYYIQSDEEFCINRIEHTVIPISITQKHALSSLEDRFSKIGIQVTGNTFYETIENRKWEMKKKLINDLYDSEDIDFELYSDITLTEEGYEFSVSQRIVPLIDKYEDVEEEIINADDIYLTLNIDSVAYEIKPDKKQVGEIQNRIGGCKRNVTVEQFIQAIENGTSFKAAALNGNKNADWQSQQVFALDIDNDDASIKKHGLLTPEEACNRFSDLGVPPVFYYSSFSSTEEKPKFRLIFIVKNPVTDIRVRNAIQMALMNIMPEADKACKDLSRLFFGTNKKCRLFSDNTNVIDPYVLVQSLIVYIRRAYSASRNDSNVIKDYCKSIGLNIVNGIPDVRIINDNNFYENEFNSIIYSIELNANTFKKVLFNFSIDKESAYRITVDNIGKKKCTKVDISIKRIKYEKTIQHFDFNLLGAKCRLWNEFIGGERWCYHEEIFGMSTNMWRVKGAESRMINAIEKNHFYVNQVDNKINTIKNSSKYGYLPMRCTNFCPYCNSCQNQGINMLKVIDNKRGQIRKLKEDTVASLAIEDGVEKLQEAIVDAFNAGEDTITVIKAPTGIGKTEVLKRLNSYDNTIIAYPNHRLGRDIVERLNIDDSIHIKELELEDKHIVNEFRRLQQIGAYKQARKFIEKYRNKMLQKYLEGLITEAEKEKTVDRINEYLSGIKESNISNKLIFCTHRKALEIQNKNIDTYIIDEDIVATTLVSTINIRVSDLQELIVACEKMNAINTKEQLNILRTSVIKAQLKPGIPLIIPKFDIKLEEVNSLIEYKKNNIIINLKELLSIRAITSYKDGTALGMSVGKLPKKRCIILSATANEVIYKKIFHDRKINFIDIDNIQIEGQVVLHYTGCSRSKLNKDFNGILKQIKTEASGVDNIITFMKFENKFKKEGFDAITHFGACSGLDSYKGQDLIVAGTPHTDERVYRLLAAIIAGKVEEHEKISYINAKRNGFEFYFNTYEECSLLREIQFYFIESELVQAIGRARVLRTDATVHVFSNYPVRGAVLYDKKIA